MIEIIILSDIHNDKSAIKDLISNLKKPLNHKRIFLIAGDICSDEYSLLKRLKKISDRVYYIFGNDDLPKKIRRI